MGANMKIAIVGYSGSGKSESDIQQSLDILELLKNALMQKYFG